MLRYMRRHQRSFVVKGVLGIIILVFIGWGVGTFDSARQTASIATVNGLTITLGELTKRHQTLTRTYQELYGAAFSPELASQLDLQGRALDDLITSALLRNEAAEMKLTVTDQEVADSIRSMPVFRPDGRFDKSVYLRFLRFERLSDEQFVEQQRQLLLARKVEALVTDGARVSDEELRARYLMENQRAAARFVRIRWRDLRDATTPTEQDLRAYYEKNPQRYQNPERVAFTYVAYRPEDFAEKDGLTEEAITQYYEEHAEDRFKSSAQVELRQLVLHVAADATQEQRDAVRARAQKLAERAAQEDFGALAREHSDDDKTADKGGALGWVERKDLPPAVASVAFSLEKGSVSDPVETATAFYVLKAEDERGPRPRPLDEVRDEVKAVLAEVRGRELAEAAASEDASQIVNGATLEELAIARGFEVEQSKPLSDKDFDPELGAAAPLVTAALALEVGETSDVLEVPRGLFLLRTTEKIPASTLPFEEVRSRVSVDFGIDNAKKLAKERAETLLASLKESKDLESLAAKESLEIDESDPFGRSGRELVGQGLDQSMAEDFFALTEANPVAPRVYTTPTGDALVAVLKERVNPDMADFDGNRDGLRDGYLQRKKQALFNTFITQLKQRAEIEVRSDFLPQT